MKVMLARAAAPRRNTSGLLDSEHSTVGRKGEESLDAYDDCVLLEEVVAGHRVHEGNVGQGRSPEEEHFRVTRL